MERGWEKYQIGNEHSSTENKIHSHRSKWMMSKNVRQKTEFGSHVEKADVRC